LKVTRETDQISHTVYMQNIPDKMDNVQGNCPMIYAG
jgi:hypothetical protein